MRQRSERAYEEVERPLVVVSSSSSNVVLPHCESSMRLLNILEKVQRRIDQPIGKRAATEASRKHNIGNSRSKSI
jgi:hypothetical protein